MPAVRPITDLPKIMHSFSMVADRGQYDVVYRATNDLAAFGTLQGSRWSLRGSKGGRFPLVAKADVKKWGRAQRAVGMVRAVPAGFWGIVEHGSSPHFITSKYAKGSRYSRARALGGRAAFSRSNRKTGVRTFGAAELGMGPVGPRATAGWGDRRAVLHWGSSFTRYARHPGHGPLGSPWANTEAAAPYIVAKAHGSVLPQQFVRAWHAA